MASSTPPHYSIAATSKPHQNPLHYPSSHKTLHNPLSKTHFPPKVSNFHSPLTTPKKSHLSPDFCSKKSTRFHSKLHYNRPKSSLSSRHSPVAEQVLEKIQSFVDSECHFENILVGFEKLLCGSEDFCFLLRELGNRGEFTKVVQCYEFAIKREKKLNERGKLVSSMISVMGRLGKIDLARNVFDNAVNEGYGNTVYTYSALISAYGRSGFYEKAIGVFEMMKNEGLKPNLVTYNAVIDACAKAGVNFKVVSEIFEEMLRNGVTPDRITFNSMLGVCKGGLWEEARGLFDEMSYWGIDQDVFTYNTLLDAICKGGKMDMAFDIMSEMTTKGVMPNVVTYSTVIDGFVKAGRLEDALVMFNEMKYMGIALDRVCYNALLSIYLKLGRFKDALDVCKDMESFGIRKDVVTYNALLGGFGKQGKYDEVKHFFEKMKVERVRPNILTFSTVIDVYSKGGLYREAMEVFREFKKAGLKADVVLYSGLIDALCKSGLVESAVLLLDEMTKEGIRPNVVTYNTIIDAFGRSSRSNYLVNSSISVDELEDKTSMVGSLNGVATNNLEGGEHDKVMVLFEQLAAKRSNSSRKFNQNTRELLCILGVFHKMHEQEIKPNVVTFSAIIHACSRCNSLEDASMLLEELRPFDDRVYGVAHGLLTGYGDTVWHQALSLFDEVKHLDSSTATAFYNALTDVLWHFGQKHGAQLVALEGKNRDVWENIWSISCLDLHLMSSGAAQAMVHAWLLNIRSIVLNGHELPKLLSILTGWGKHSKIVGDSVLKRSIEVLLSGLGAPFHLAETNLGRFISQGVAVSAWLKKAATYKVLLLKDDRTHLETNKVDQRFYLQPLPLECTFCNISVT